MNFSIYFNTDEKDLLVTSNFEEFQKRMDLGIFPKSTYIQTDIDGLSKLDFQIITLYNVKTLDFQYFKNIFLEYSFQIVAIHNSTLDFEDMIIITKHLVIGEKVKVNLLERNFSGLCEITFLSVKTFKGIIQEPFINVKKLILWYENSRSNDILKHFPNLIEFQSFNGSTVDLSLSENRKLKILHLHNFPKLESIDIKPDDLEELIVYGCKKLKFVL